MKKTRKKLFALLMTACMLVWLVPTTSSAVWWNPDAIDVTTEAELQTAINEATGEDTEIVLGQDIQLTKTLEVGNSVTIHLYGNDITYASDDGPAIWVKEGVTLDIYGYDDMIHVTGNSNGALAGIQVDGSMILSQIDLAVYNAGSGDAFGIKSEKENASVSLTVGSRVRAQSAGNAYGVYLENNAFQTTTGTDSYDDEFTMASLYCGDSVITALSGGEKTSEAIYMTAGSDAGASPEVYLESSYVVGQKKTGEGYESGTAIHTGEKVTVNIDDNKEYSWISSCVYGALNIAKAGTETTGIVDGYFSVDPGTGAGSPLQTDRTTEPAEEDIYVEYEDEQLELSGLIYHVLPAGKVARIDTDYYSTLKEAFEDAEDTDEIHLVNDVQLDEDITVSLKNTESISSKRLRLNLNGKKLYGGGTLIVGSNDGSLSLVIRDVGSVQQPCSVPIKVHANSYLTINNGTFDVWPTMADPQTPANKHIFIIGGSFKKTAGEMNVLQSCARGGVITEVGDYYTVSQSEQPVIVVIGEEVTSYGDATAAFEYLNQQAAKGPVEAIMSVNGPAKLTKDTTLGENVDLTMVYSFYYNQHFITSGEGGPYTLTIDGASITSGDTAYTPYALLMDNANLVVNSGTIVGQTGNSARKESVYAIKVSGGDVTVNGGRILANGRREYTGRDNRIYKIYTDRDILTDYTEYRYDGTKYTAAIWDNAAYGIFVGSGDLKVSDGADIRAVGSNTYATYVTADGSTFTMDGGKIASMAYRHPGRDEFNCRDFYQWGYGVYANYDDILVDVSGGEIYAGGSYAGGLSNNTGPDGLTLVSDVTIRAEGSREAVGLICSQGAITGGNISAVCHTGSDWRKHYNAVGLAMNLPFTSVTVDGKEYKPVVSGATVNATAEGEGEACGLYFKGRYDWTDYDEDTDTRIRVLGEPAITVEDCTVNATAEGDSFSCAVNNDGGYSTTINSGTYTSTCRNGFADCVCAYYTSDLFINGGTFTVQADSRGETSEYSGEKYAATCIYNQGDGDTVITGGKFRMMDENGETVISDKIQDPGEDDSLFRLLRVHNPKTIRYDEELDDYVDSKDPTLTVSGGYFSDKVALTSPDVVAEGYQVLSSGDSTYPWTVGKPSSGGDPSGKPDDGDDSKECPKDSTCPISKFSDSKPDAWYHDGVHYVLEEGIMNGVSKDKFAPNESTTRAMIVTMLWRMEGEPKAKASGFTDLEAGSWYEAAVNWAAEKKIVNGYDEKTFGPGDKITREQFAAILFRYAEYKGVRGEAYSVDLSKYTDVSAVSDWALDAMNWCVATELITGVTETTLEPKENATRAQTATILMRFNMNMQEKATE